jgi:hypothetical protein
MQSNPTVRLLTANAVSLLCEIFIAFPKGSYDEVTQPEHGRIAAARSHSYRRAFSGFRHPGRNFPSSIAAAPGNHSSPT